MPALPANFISRLDLQRLLTRCGDLLRSIKNSHLAHGLQQIHDGAACLEGVLSELPATTHPTDKVLDNPNAWQTEWRAIACYVHTANELCEFKFEQQFVLRPNDNGLAISTGRFRVVLGDDVFTSCDRMVLRSHTVYYLSRFGDAISEYGKNRILDHFFPEVEEVERAVC